MTLGRRRFLQASGGALAAWASSPWWLQAGLAATATTPGRRLIVLNLAGGNDGLNTVVPYGISGYYANRPTLATPAAKVLKLAGSSAVGLHPSLPTMHALYGRGEVAIVQGVGYDHPDLSHFGSGDIWQTGSPTHAFGSGWLGRWLDQTGHDTGHDASPLRAVAIGNYVPLALIGERDQGVALTSLPGFQFADGAEGDAKSDARHRHDDFVRSVSTVTGGDVATAYADSVRQTVASVRAVNRLATPSAPYPTTPAQQVGLAMTLLASPVGVRVAMVEVDGFDDHAGEGPNHPTTLKQVDDAVAAFRDLVAKQPNPQDYLLMTFSEFGRRLAEDGSGGTDHGTAGPLFVVGPRVKGGLYGEHPALTPSGLDENGNLVRTVDFREVYATMLDGWLGGASSRDVLGYTSADGLHPLAFLR